MPGDPQQRWYKFDDDSVSPVDGSGVVTKAAYVLFYRRRGAEMDLEGLLEQHCQHQQLQHQQLQHQQLQHQELLAFDSAMRERFDAAESQLGDEAGPSQEGGCKFSLFDLTDRLSRMDAAKLFYQVMVTRSNGFLETEQREPFGDVLLSRGAHLYTEGDDAATIPAAATAGPPAEERIQHLAAAADAPPAAAPAHAAAMPSAAAPGVPAGLPRDCIFTEPAWRAAYKRLRDSSVQFPFSVAGVKSNMAQLHSAVLAAGGVDAVLRSKDWAAVAAALDIPANKAGALAAKYEQRILPVLAPAVATDPASDAEGNEHLQG